MGIGGEGAAGHRGSRGIVEGGLVRVAVGGRRIAPRTEGDLLIPVVGVPQIAAIDVGGAVAAGRVVTFGWLITASA